MGECITCGEEIRGGDPQIQYDVNAVNCSTEIDHEFRLCLGCYRWVRRLTSDSCSLPDLDESDLDRIRETADRDRAPQPTD
jgi:hypothetical protein